MSQSTVLSQTKYSFSSIHHLQAQSSDALGESISNRQNIAVIHLNYLISILVQIHTVTMRSIIELCYVKNKFSFHLFLCFEGLAFLEYLFDMTAGGSKEGHEDDERAVIPGLLEKG